MATENGNGYGTVGNGNAGRGAGTRGVVDEEQALLGQPPAKSNWRSHLTVNVHRDWADLVLLLCYFVTGLLDSASIQTWGSFVSMQTGEPHLTHIVN